MSQENEPSKSELEELARIKLSKNINELQEEQLTFGNKLADKLADFAGSWKFIIMFLIIMCVWIVVNSFALITKPYDPYPFILLNLILSCIAALQAPIIMMSQKRQETKDRLRSQNDYNVDVKTEALVEHMIFELKEIKTQQINLLKSLEKLSDDVTKTNRLEE
jgi:uncharacterized membrane protein